MIANFSFFFTGITVASFTGSGIFFLKLWRASKDRFFFYFAFACLIYAASNVLALFKPASLESFYTNGTGDLLWVYLMRLLAYGAIVIAVIEKNRG